jgi:hypothetical protein
MDLPNTNAFSVRRRQRRRASSDVRQVSILAVLCWVIVAIGLSNIGGSSPSGQRRQANLEPSQRDQPSTVDALEVAE